MLPLVELENGMHVPDHLTITLRQPNDGISRAALLPFAGTVATACIGLLVYKFAERNREQALLLDTLRLLGGNAQDRVTGIAMCEYLSRKKKFIPILKSVLEGQKHLLQKVREDNGGTLGAVEAHAHDRITHLLDGWG